MSPKKRSVDQALAEAQQRAKALYAELEELETKAGIADKTKRAREGNLFSLGAVGEECTPDEYFADEYDDLRRHIREAYFAVEDADLRKSLIAKTLKSDKADAEAIAISMRRDIERAQRQLEEARRAADHDPWVRGALLGIILVSGHIPLI
jgi:hypothetical protein